MFAQPLKLTALLLFAATALTAQKGALGIQAGAFASTLKLAEVHYAFSWQAGFAGGVFYRIPLHGGLSLQPEVNFVRRPLRGTYSYDTYNALDPHVVLDYSADQNIWELGAILHREFGEGRLRPFAGGGLFAGFLTDKKVTYTRDGAPYSISAFRSNDVSVLLESGLGMQIAENLSFALGFRYSIGFNQHGASPLSNSRIGAKFHRFLFNAGIARSF